ncbi:hypothetical protein N7540_009769 [Penicillium herquei]|nr:hypothetical protein N7540_009769 [Penicillium herquei]
MIPEAVPGQPVAIQATLQREDQTSRDYGGEILKSKFDRLICAMGIVKSWEWRVIYVSTRMEFMRGNMNACLKPLSEEIELDPGGRIEGGSFAYTNPAALARSWCCCSLPPIDKQEPGSIDQHDDDLRKQLLEE